MLEWSIDGHLDRDGRILRPLVLAT